MLAAETLQNIEPPSWPTKWNLPTSEQPWLMIIWGVLMSLAKAVKVPNSLSAMTAVVLKLMNMAP